MRHSRLLGILLLSFSSSGCHVVDKARECSALSTVLEKAQKTINAPEKAAPSRKGLEAKASEYRELAQAVEALKFSEKTLVAQQKALVEQFHQIETQLGHAAEVLKEAEAPSEMISGDVLPANSEPARPPAAEAEQKPRVVPPHRQQPASADVAGRKQNRDQIPADRGRRGPSTKMSASRHRTESFKRRYAQASKAIETANHQVGSLVKRISELCRD